MPEPRAGRVFSVTGAVALVIISAVVVIALLVDAVIRSGIVNALLLAPWMLLVLWLIYVVGIASDVRADQRGVQVQNFLRRTWMPWSRVGRITMRWQLEFSLDDAAIVRCFGGPVRSRPRRLGPERTQEVGDAAAEDGVAKLHRLRTESIPAPDAHVERSWDWMAILALVLIVVWAAVAIAATR